MVQGKYYELKLKINPDIEDIISEICFEVFPCEGVVLAEETYKDLEIVSTTEGTLRVFLNFDKYVLPLRDDRNLRFRGGVYLEDFIAKTLTEQRNILLSRGLSE